LIVTKYLGNTQVGVFQEDGMVGLSPNPKTKVESFPEYLVRAKLILKHTMHFNETTIIVGGHGNSSAGPTHWSIYVFS
jgi:hypothetical protein